MAVAARAAASCLDHIVFVLPRADDKYQAFATAAPESVVIVPRLASAAEAGRELCVDEVPAKWELMSAHAELIAALNADTMAAAAARAGVSAADLEEPEGRKRAAQMWLHEVTALCIEGLADSVPEATVVMLCAGLNSSDSADATCPSAEVSEMQEEFGKSARALVTEYYRLQRQSQCVNRRL